MLELCRKIIEYAESGDPIKDVLEPTKWREDTLLVELARRYVADRTGGQVRRERADL